MRRNRHIIGLGADVIPPFKRDLLQYLVLVSFLLSCPALSHVLLYNKECFDLFLKCVRFANVNINLYIFYSDDY